MLVYDSAWRRLELGAPLFVGGEGVICAVSTRPGLLAKLYKPDKRAGKESKLAWMTANPPLYPGCGAGQASIAWPETLLYENSGDFIGFLMPRIIDAKTLFHVINPRLRAQTLPAFDQIYLHRAARNLAAALHALHEREVVIGDLNETNVLVAPTALVTVIDTDSFQVKETHAGQVTFYPCPVGRPEYTPPELQGRAFLNVVRQPEQDAFALAVLIFQLLMDGSHPFRSAWLGRGDPPPIEEKIIQGWFPYAPAPRGPVRSPPGLSLDRLHPTLTDLMRRCFIDGHDNPHCRPSAAEWESVLKDAERALSICQSRRIYVARFNPNPRYAAQRMPTASPPAIKPVTPLPVVTLQASPLPRAATPPVAVACPRCATLNLIQRVYCWKCAAHLHSLAVCPHCGQLTAQGMQAKYCEVCGRRL